MVSYFDIDNWAKLFDSVGNPLDVYDGTISSNPFLDTACPE